MIPEDQQTVVDVVDQQTVVDDCCRCPRMYTDETVEVSYALNRDCVSTNGG